MAAIIHSARACSRGLSSTRTRIWVPVYTGANGSVTITNIMGFFVISQAQAGTIGINTSGNQNGTVYGVMVSVSRAHQQHEYNHDCIVPADDCSRRSSDADTTMPLTITVVGTSDRQLEELLRGPEIRLRRCRRRPAGAGPVATAQPDVLVLDIRDTMRCRPRS